MLTELAAELSPVGRRPEGYRSSHPLILRPEDEQLYSLPCSVIQSMIDSERSVQLLLSAHLEVIILIVQNAINS